MSEKLQQRAARGLERMAHGTLVALSLLLILAAGALDYSTGTELSFSVFYLLPVGLVAWYVGRTAGIWVAGAGTLVWVAAEFSPGQFPSHPLAPVWNTAVRFGFFLVLTYTVSALNHALAREKALARTDPLTGARNNRSFNEALEAEMGRLRRYERPFTLVYLDVDDFKLVNDGQGHSRGDELLHLIAETLRDCLRRSDVVARLGGDEFAVLLPEAGTAAAEGALRKLERQLDNLVTGGQWPVTFSVGAVTFLESPNSVDACLEKADSIMYAVKNTGKNGILHQVIGESVSQPRS